MPRKKLILPAFERSLVDHMSAWRKDFDGSAAPIFRIWHDGVFPEFRDVCREVARVDGIAIDRDANTLTSPQVFTLNLFAPFRARGCASLAGVVEAAIQEPVALDHLTFNWRPPAALLGEQDGNDRNPHPGATTSVDVAIWCTRAGGQRGVLLLSVKLGGAPASACVGRDSPSNGRPELCRSAATFFANTSVCYLQRPFGRMTERRYWAILAESSGSVRNAFARAPLDGPCPFAFNTHQPMRHYALARGLEVNGTVERAWFGLCVHDGNREASMQWRAWQELLPEPAMAPQISASAIVAAGRAAGHVAWADWMERRYRLAWDPEQQIA